MIPGNPPCVGGRALGIGRDRTTYLSARTLSGAYKAVGVSVLGRGYALQGRGGVSIGGTGLLGRGYRVVG